MTVTFTLLDVTVSTTSAHVSIKGVAEQLTDLANAVAPVGPGSSLADKVALVQADLAASDIADACGTLSAFINQVSAQAGKKQITPDQAASLTAQAANIQALLGC